MTIVKQNPRIINHVFEEFLNGFPTTWGKDVHTAATIPAVNIHETAEAYHVELIAAGRKKEDFKIQLENSLLTISYEKKEESEQKDYKTIRKEFGLNSFKRSFTVDEKINVEGIQAKYENGILKLLLPKKEEIKVSPKEITIL